MIDDAASVPEFKILVRLGDDRAILGVSGEVDLKTAPDLATILDAVAARGNAKVTLDFSELKFMDASGLGVLAPRAFQLRASGGVLVVRSSSPFLRRLFEITNLTELIHLEEAESMLSASPDEGLARQLKQVNAVLVGDDLVDSALRLVVAFTRHTVGGTDGVSVSLTRHGHLTTVAASDETVVEMDAHQYATGQGPCVAASSAGRPFYITSMDTEARWSAFTPQAQTLGIKAILSSPLLADERPIGALNIYSRVADAFSPTEQQLAAVIAGEASLMLTDAGAAVTEEQLAARLGEALRTREVIAHAQGMTMNEMGVDAHEAFTFLRKLSRNSNRSMRDIAIEVVGSAGQPFHFPTDQSSDRA